MDVNKGGQEVKCDNCDFLEIVKIILEENLFNCIGMKIIILSELLTYEVNIAEEDQVTALFNWVKKLL